MTLSQNHHMVPTQLEDMIEEVEERLLWILNGVWEVINDLQDIIDKLEYDPPPAPPTDFYLSAPLENTADFNNVYSP